MRFPVHKGRRVKGAFAHGYVVRDVQYSWTCSPMAPSPKRGKIGASAAASKEELVNVVHVTVIGGHPIRLAILVGFVGLVVVIAILGVLWWTKRK